ncbi:MAG: PT domain-containing protein [Rickettsiales bacterium]
MIVFDVRNLALSQLLLIISTQWKLILGQQNIVVNPGAELGNTGWNNLAAVGSVSNSQWVVSGSLGSGCVHSGSHVFATYSTTIVSISQYLSMIPGATYAVSCWIGDASPNNAVYLSIGGNILISEIDIAAGTTQYTTSYVPKSSIETLLISGYTILSGAAICLDDISVTFISSPIPTATPTLAPIASSTPAPTLNPITAVPTPAPTTVPTPMPTVSPTLDPTPDPTKNPNPLPTQAPTSPPTKASFALELRNFFRANNYADYDQFYPAITQLRNGNLVAVWHDNREEGAFDVYMSIWDSLGHSMSNHTDIKVNDATFGSQMWPAIASLNNGDFIVCYTDYNTNYVMFKIFHPDVTTVTSARITLNNEVKQDFCNIEVFPNDNIAIVYKLRNNQDVGGLVKVVILNKFGGIITPPFQISQFYDDNPSSQTENSGYLKAHDTAILKNGMVAVVWMFDNGNNVPEAPGWHDLYIKIFGINGMSILTRSELQATGYDEIWPKITGLDDGTIVFAWSEFAQGECFNLFIKKLAINSENNALVELIEKTPAAYYCGANTYNGSSMKLLPLGGDFILFYTDNNKYYNIFFDNNFNKVSERIQLNPESNSATYYYKGFDAIISTNNTLVFTDSFSDKSWGGDIYVNVLQIINYFPTVAPILAPTAVPTELPTIISSIKISLINITTIISQESDGHDYIRLDLKIDNDLYLSVFEDGVDRGQTKQIQYSFTCLDTFWIKAWEGDASQNGGIVDSWGLINYQPYSCQGILNNHLYKATLEGNGAKYEINYALVYFTALPSHTPINTPTQFPTSAPTTAITEQLISRISFLEDIVINLNVSVEELKNSSQACCTANREMMETEFNQTKLLMDRISNCTECLTCLGAVEVNQTND